MSVNDNDSEKKRASRKDWKSIIENHVIPTLNQLRNQNIPVNLRMIFYNLVSKGVIGNTPSDYDTLSDKTKHARMNDVIPIDAFVDEVRQTFDNDYQDDDAFETSEDYIDRAINYLRKAPENYVKQLPSWYKQKHYLEMWLEKGALNTIFVAYLDNRHVRIAINRGNTSLGFMVENIRRLRHVAKTEPDKKIHLRYSGDMDPSGDDMDRDLVKRIESVNAAINILEIKAHGNYAKMELWYLNNDRELIEIDDALKFGIYLDDGKRKKLTQDEYNELLDKKRIRISKIVSHYHPEIYPHFNEDNIDFKRIAVTIPQILEHNLPEIPTDEKTKEKLKNDPRTKTMKKKYGRLIAVEVDALNALYPEVFKQIIQDSVDFDIDKEGNKKLDDDGNPILLYDPKIYEDEILKPYGSKEYKAGIKETMLQRLKDFIAVQEMQPENFKDELEPITDMSVNDEEDQQ